MESPFSRRVVVAAALLLALAAGGFVLGWVSAVGVARWIGERGGLDEVAVAGPGDLVVMQLVLGLALSLPPLAACVAVIVHGVRVGAAPGRATAIYLAIPSVVVAAAMGLRFAWISWALSSMRSERTLGMEPMVLFGDPGLGPWALRAGIPAALVLWLIVFLRARPKERPVSSRRSGS